MSVDVIAHATLEEFAVNQLKQVEQIRLAQLLEIGSGDGPTGPQGGVDDIPPFGLSLGRSKGGRVDRLSQRHGGC